MRTLNPSNEMKTLYPSNRTTFEATQVADSIEPTSPPDELKGSFKLLEDESSLDVSISGESRLIGLLKRENRLLRGELASRGLLIDKLRDEIELKSKEISTLANKACKFSASLERAEMQKAHLVQEIELRNLRLKYLEAKLSDGVQPVKPQTHIFESSISKENSAITPNLPVENEELKACKEDLETLQTAYEGLLGALGSAEAGREEIEARATAQTRRVIRYLESLRNSLSPEELQGLIVQESDSELAKEMKLFAENARQQRLSDRKGNPFAQVSGDLSLPGPQSLDHDTSDPWTLKIDSAATSELVFLKRELDKVAEMLGVPTEVPFASFCQDENHYANLFAVIKTACQNRSISGEQPALPVSLPSPTTLPDEAVSVLKDMLFRLLTQQTEETAENKHTKTRIELLESNILPETLEDLIAKISEMQKAKTSASENLISELKSRLQEFETANKSLQSVLEKKDIELLQIPQLRAQLESLKKSEIDSTAGNSRLRVCTELLQASSQASNCSALASLKDKARVIELSSKLVDAEMEVKLSKSKIGQLETHLAGLRKDVGTLNEQNMRLVNDSGVPVRWLA